MTRRLSRLASAATIGTLAVAVALVASPSQAEPEKLVVSRTSTGPFTQNLTSPLFGNIGRMVPTDSATGSFFVKNNSEGPARATLTVVDRGVTNELARGLTLTYDLGGTASDAPVRVGSTDGCATYVTGPSIAPGATQAVSVSLAFDDVTGQDAMSLDAGLDFVLTLSEVGPKGRVDVCGVQAVAEPHTICTSADSTVVTLIGSSPCPVVAGVEAVAGPGGTLADTGAPRSLRTLVPLGLGLLLTGAGLLMARRRVEAP